MPSVRVNLDDLMMALDDHSGDAQWFLDRDSGEVLRVGDEMFGETDDALSARIDAAPERFIAIEPTGSRDGYALMEEFTAALAEGSSRTALERALRGRKPFRAFKEALLDYPSERERWFRFADERTRAAARAWLADNGVTAHESSSCTSAIDRLELK